MSTNPSAAVTRSQWTIPVFTTITNFSRWFMFLQYLHVKYACLRCPELVCPQIVRSKVATTSENGDVSDCNGDTDCHVSTHIALDVTDTAL
jgi:hypothetical protein